MLGRKTSMRVVPAHALREAFGANLRGVHLDAGVTQNSDELVEAICLHEDVDVDVLGRSRDAMNAERERTTDRVGEPCCFETLAKFDRQRERVSAVHGQPHEAA